MGRTSRSISLSQFTILRPSLRTLRMRRARLHLLSGTNRICGVADDFVSRLEITEDLYIAVHTQTGNHIHPFRLPVAYSLDEGARSEERRVGKECRSRWSPYH